jgi:hypothetical protein
MAEQTLWISADVNKSVSVIEQVIIGLTVLALLMSFFVWLTGQLLKSDILSPSDINH